MLTAAGGWVTHAPGLTFADSFSNVLLASDSLRLCEPDPTLSAEVLPVSAWMLAGRGAFCGCACCAILVFDFVEPADFLFCAICCFICVWDHRVFDHFRANDFARGAKCALEEHCMAKRRHYSSMWQSIYVLRSVFGASPRRFCA